MLRLWFRTAMGHWIFYISRGESKCPSGGSGVSRDKGRIYFPNFSPCRNLSFHSGSTATLQHHQYILIHPTQPHQTSLPHPPRSASTLINSARLIRSLLPDCRSHVVGIFASLVPYMTSATPLMLNNCLLKSYEFIWAGQPWWTGHTS